MYIIKICLIINFFINYQIRQGFICGWMMMMIHYQLMMLANDIDAVLPIFKHLICFVI